MSLIKRSYSKVSSISHAYINRIKEARNMNTQGQAIGELVNSHKAMLALGIDAKMIDKLELLKEMLGTDSANVQIGEVLNIVINKAMSQAIQVGKLNSKEVLKSKSQATGTARVRINNFIKMVKEHNSKSVHTIKITQTLISTGLKSTGSNTIDLDLLKCSDKLSLVSGTNSNRKAIKTAVQENSNFTAYNEALGTKTTRAHNLATIKNLSL